MASHQTQSDIEMAEPRDQKPTDVNTETIEAVYGSDQYMPGKDKAAQLLKEAGHAVVVTPEDNKRILRKIDLAILPIILVIYCLQSLDKTALSYASVFGLVKDTNLVGHEYSWLGGKTNPCARPRWYALIIRLVFDSHCLRCSARLATSRCLFPGQTASRKVLRYHGVLLGRDTVRYVCRPQLRRLDGRAIHPWIFRGVSGADFHRKSKQAFRLEAYGASDTLLIQALVQMWYRRSEQTNRNAAWYSMLGIVNIVSLIIHTHHRTR
jgi:hypothetical protein